MFAPKTHTAFNIASVMMISMTVNVGTDTTNPSMKINVSNTGGALGKPLDTVDLM